MKKLWGAIALVTFFLLLGTTGALENTDMIMRDAIVRYIVLFPILAISLKKCSESYER